MNFFLAVFSERDAARPDEVIRNCENHEANDDDDDEPLRPGGVEAGRLQRVGRTLPW